MLHTRLQYNSNVFQVDISSIAEVSSKDQTDKADIGTGDVGSKRKRLFGDPSLPGEESKLLIGSDAGE